MFYIYADGNLIYRPLEPTMNLLNPKITLEMGKAGSLEFGLPSTNNFYNSMQPLVTDIKVELDGDEIFFGRVLSSKKAFNNVKTVYCEGDLAYLVDSVQKCTAYNGNTHELFSKIVAAHNARVEDKKKFTVGNVTIENRSVKLTGQSEDINVGNIDYKQIAINSIVDEWNNTYDFIKTTLIDYCGGYLRTRHENGVAYLDYVKDYFGTTSQMIELGSNLLDLNDELKVDEIFTVLIPLGDDNLTIASVNNGSDELVNQNLVNQYGRIIKTHVFSNVNNASTLLENAQRFMETNAKSVRTLEISAVDLHLINPNIQTIHLGDKVKIFSIPHDMNEELTCTKIEYDLTNPGNNKYTFGNPQQTLTERYREDARKQSDTYGNSAAASGASAGRSGGGAAAAAGAAGEKADEEQKGAEERFFDAWIGLDKADAGKITLNAIQMLQANDRSKLKNDIGIDLDAATGNINIHNFRNEYDTNKTVVFQQMSEIDSKHTDAESTLTAYVARVDSKHEGYYSTINQRVTDESANIMLEVKKGDKENADKAASIEIALDNVENELRSAINLKADQITLDTEVATITGRLEAAEAAFENLTTGRTTANQILTLMLKTKYLNVDTNEAYINGKSITTTSHSHRITANSDGTVTFGDATSSPQSFNQADTAFYKNGVSAARTEGINSVILSSLTVNTARGTSGVQWGSSYKTARIYLNALLSNGKQYNGASDHISIDTSAAYSAGESSGYSTGYSQGASDEARNYRSTSLWLGYNASGWQSGGNKRGSRCTATLWVRNGTRYERFYDAVYYDGGSYSGGYTSIENRGYRTVYVRD